PQVGARAEVAKDPLRVGTKGIHKAILLEMAYAVEELLLRGQGPALGVRAHTPQPRLLVADSEDELGTWERTVELAIDGWYREIEDRVDTRHHPQSETACGDIVHDLVVVAPVTGTKP